MQKLLSTEWYCPYHHYDNSQTNYSEPQSYIDQREGGKEEWRVKEEGKRGVVRGREKRNGGWMREGGGEGEENGIQ